MIPVPWTFNCSVSKQELRGFRHFTFKISGYSMSDLLESVKILAQHCDRGARWLRWHQDLALVWCRRVFGGLMVGHSPCVWQSHRPAWDPWDLIRYRCICCESKRRFEVCSLSKIWSLWLRQGWGAETVAFLLCSLVLMNAVNSAMGIFEYLQFINYEAKSSHNVNYILANLIMQNVFSHLMC